MTGMFSLLGVLFGMPLAEVLAPLAISDAVRAALLEREGELGALLALVESAERGDFADVAARLPGCQLDAARFQRGRAGSGGLDARGGKGDRQWNQWLTARSNAASPCCAARARWKGRRCPMRSTNSKRRSWCLPPERASPTNPIRSAPNLRRGRAGDRARHGRLPDRLESGRGDAVRLHRRGSDRPARAVPVCRRRRRHRYRRTVPRTGQRA